MSNSQKNPILGMSLYATPAGLAGQSPTSFSIPTTLLNLAGHSGKPRGPLGAPASSSNPVAEIERQLMGRFTNSNAKSRLSELSKQFGRLSSSQASQVFKKIFYKSDQASIRFYRLTSQNRALLTLELARRSHHQDAEQIFAMINGTYVGGITENSANRRLKKLLPNSSQRTKFMQSLNRTISRFHPGASDDVVVKLRLRTQGSWSTDNKSKIATSKYPKQKLGVDRNSGKNFIEIRGDVSGHRPDAQYRLSRTIERNSWYRRGSSVWAPYRITTHDNYKPPGTPDDGNDTDEDATPEKNHIYSVDGPGYKPLRPDFPGGKKGYARTTAFLSMMNAIEIAEVRIGKGPWKVADTVDWCSIIGAEKVDGKWRRTPGSQFNSIGPGMNVIGDSETPLLKW